MFLQFYVMNLRRYTTFGIARRSDPYCIWRCLLAHTFRLPSGPCDIFVTALLGRISPFFKRIFRYLKGTLQSEIIYGNFGITMMSVLSPDLRTRTRLYWHVLSLQFFLWCSKTTFWSLGRIWINRLGRRRRRKPKLPRSYNRKRNKSVFTRSSESLNSSVEAVRRTATIRHSSSFRLTMFTVDGRSLFPSTVTRLLLSICWVYRY